MLKTVYSALAVTAFLAGTASFAADQTPTPAAVAAPVAATASTVAAPAAATVTPAKETVKPTHHVVKAVKKDAAASTETSATPAAKK